MFKCWIICCFFCATRRFFSRFMLKCDINLGCNGSQGNPTTLKLYSNLFEHFSINLKLAIKARLSFNIIFLLRAVANIVLYSMRDRYDPFWHFISEAFFGREMRKSAQITMEKGSLEDSEFMSFWRAEVGRKNDGKTKLLSFLLFSISIFPLRSFSLLCPSYHICRVHLSRVDAHSPPTCYLSFHGNWVAAVLHKYIL